MFLFMPLLTMHYIMFYLLVVMFVLLPMILHCNCSICNITDKALSHGASWCETRLLPFEEIIVCHIAEIRFHVY